MTLEKSDLLRLHLSRILDWEDAHVNFDSTVEGIPDVVRGKQLSGIPYTAWQLIEHMHLAQKDILDFCLDPQYKEAKWPDDYWPKSPAPPSSAAWKESIASFRKDSGELKRLAEDPGLDLYAKIPHGSGQTYLRELLLVADHNAYHVGQLVLIRRLLGEWR